MVLFEVLWRILSRASKSCFSCVSLEEFQSVTILHTPFGISLSLTDWMHFSDCPLFDAALRMEQRFRRCRTHQRYDFNRCTKASRWMLEVCGAVQGERKQSPSSCYKDGLYSTPVYVMIYSRWTLTVLASISKIDPSPGS